MVLRACASGLHSPKPKAQQHSDAQVSAALVLTWASLSVSSGSARGAAPVLCSSMVSQPVGSLQVITACWGWTHKLTPVDTR